MRYISAEMTEQEIKNIFKNAKEALSENKQFAIIVKRDALEAGVKNAYQNDYTLCREDAISEIIKEVDANDVIVSTTGKISREVYEQCDKQLGHHKQAFLTVGGMGHAGMIAYGIAQNRTDKKVYCIEGDGAVLMHMGELAFLAKQQPKNFIHICLNNEAHESVGGMPTGAVGDRLLQDSTGMWVFLCGKCRQFRGSAKATAIHCGHRGTCLP